MESIDLGKMLGIYLNNQIKWRRSAISKPCLILTIKVHPVYSPQSFIQHTRFQYLSSDNFNVVKEDVILSFIERNCSFSHSKCIITIKNNKLEIPEITRFYKEYKGRIKKVVEERLIINYPTRHLDCYGTLKLTNPRNINYMQKIKYLDLIHQITA